jgi:hypothetical protein
LPRGRHGMNLTVGALENDSVPETGIVNETGVDR